MHPLRQIVISRLNGPGVHQFLLVMCGTTGLFCGGRNTASWKRDPAGTQNLLNSLGYIRNIARDYIAKSLTVIGFHYRNPLFVSSSVATGVAALVPWK